MASHLERISKISPLRAMLAAGGLALLLLLGVAAPASAQDYPTPLTTPTSVQRNDVTNTLPRTGSDNTQTLAIVGGAVLVAGAGLVVVGKRRHDRHATTA